MNYEKNNKQTHEDIENEIFDLLDEYNVKNMKDYNDSSILFKTKINTLIIYLYDSDEAIDDLRLVTSLDENIKNYIELNNNLINQA